MTKTIQWIASALAFGAAVSAHAQIGGNVPETFDLNAQSHANRVAVAQEARQAIATHAFHDEFFGSNARPQELTHGQSARDRAQVRAEAAQAVQQHTLSVGN